MAADPQETTKNHGKVMSAIAEGSDAYPKPAGVTFAYGTAGFRMNASKLPSVLYRTALLAVLRSKRLEGATIGVMVTASHNPAADNGVKIVDPSGEMLEQSWEAHATALSNCPSTESLVSTFTTLANHLRIDLNAPSAIVFARDTRPSGEDLVKALRTGLEAFGSSVKITDLGITTTPALHHVVRATNDKSGHTGTPTVDGYVEKLAKAFKVAIGNRGPLAPLYVDCANGVGINILSSFSKLVADVLPISPVNTDTSNPAALNSQCGADYVKTKQALPPSVQSAGYLSKPGTRACSFDGDADRIVYYFMEDGKTFKLLDGDKIAVMVAMFFVDLVNKTKLSEDKRPEVGVVQTAYANGSSTKYLRSRNIPVTCVPTGVKHLHHAAQRYDIGVYFEANGHGTVLFSDDCLENLRNAEPDSPDSANAIKHLLAFSDLINQAVGDSLSDMLMVEAVLAHRGWGAFEWNAAYEDLPNRLLKVEVPDRNIFVATDAERKLASPELAQGRIEEAMRKVEAGRAFVRPSGTEDCVRVYAEASTNSQAEALANTIADIVRQFSGQT